MADSDYRFFPTVPDEMFGYVLHPVDLAMNKVMAAAGRRERRDIVDLVMIHETNLPLGAVICAAADKAPGFTSEGLIAEIWRNSNYLAAKWRALPTEKLGLLFLKDSKVVQPGLDHLDEYESHAGRRQARVLFAR